MCVVDWTVPFTIESKYGTIDLNGTTGYNLINDQCSSGADLRVGTDNIPSGDGAIMHDIFASGYAMNIALQFWETSEQPACGSTLEDMKDALQFHLNAMRHDTGRVLWTPAGHAQKILDQVRLTQRAIAGYQGEGGVITTFGFDFGSPFPYYITAAQTVTPVLSGATFTFVNGGTADFYPVIKVYGPTTGGFVITNVTTGLRFVYEPALPGGNDIASGHYLELDFFRDTAYLDGDQDNYKAGINIPESDFFPITVEPLGNVIGIQGARMDVLWNDAFA